MQWFKKQLWWQWPLVCPVAELPGSLQVLLDASVTLLLSLTGAH